jgi:hypothetical protein
MRSEVDYAERWAEVVTVTLPGRWVEFRHFREADDALGYYFKLTWPQIEQLVFAIAHRGLHVIERDESGPDGRQLQLPLGPEDRE